MFLYLITGAAHYLILSMNAKNERARMERYISECKAQAWPNGYPPADASKRRVQDSTGRIFTIYADGTVWIVDAASGHEYLLDVDEIPDAQWKNTLLVKLPKWAWNSTLGKYIPKREAKIVPEEIKVTAANGQRQSKKSKSEDRLPAASEPAEGAASKKIGDAPKMPLKTKTLADGSVVAEASNVAGGRRRRKK